MRTINLVPVLLGLLLVTGQLILHPNSSAATVAKVGEELQTAHMTSDTYPFAPISLHPQLSEPDAPTPFAAHDAFIRVANAPQAPETCAEKWKMDVSHKSWRCIDGHWQQFTEEQWICKSPQQTVDHTHRQGTQDSCSAS